MGVKREFFRCVLPSTAAFALAGVYAIVDGYFVGNTLGDNGLAAINLAYPVTAFIQAAGTGIGLAGAIRFAILRGQGREREGAGCMSLAFLLLAAAALLLTAAALGFTAPLLGLLGSRGEVAPLAEEYLRVIAVGAIFQVFATGLVPFIRNLGGASFAMWTMIAGFLTNVALDYLLVWVRPFGMAGAAWATVIGQGVTALMSAAWLAAKRVRLVRPGGGVGPTLVLAVAPFGLTFSPQITVVLMNRALMEYGGGLAVAVYSCIVYITVIIYLLFQGVGDGSQPLVSRYFGEGRRAELNESRRLAYISAAAVAVVSMAAVYLCRGLVGPLFGTSEAAAAEAARLFPLFLAPLPLLAYTRVTTSNLYATEKAGASYLLVYAEPVLTLALLLALPGPLGLGLDGVWLAVPAAQALNWAISLAVKHAVK